MSAKQDNLPCWRCFDCLSIDPCKTKYTCNACNKIYFHPEDSFCSKCHAVVATFRIVKERKNKEKTTVLYCKDCYYGMRIRPLARAPSPPSVSLDLDYFPERERSSLPLKQKSSESLLDYFRESLPSSASCPVCWSTNPSKSCCRCDTCLQLFINMTRDQSSWLCLVCGQDNPSPYDYCDTCATERKEAMKTSRKQKKHPPSVVLLEEVEAEAETEAETESKATGEWPEWTEDKTECKDLTVHCPLFHRKVWDENEARKYTQQQIELREQANALLISAVIRGHMDDINRAEGQGADWALARDSDGRDPLILSVLNDRFDIYQRAILWCPVQTDYYGNNFKEYMNVYHNHFYFYIVRLHRILVQYFPILIDDMFPETDETYDDTPRMIPLIIGYFIA